MLDNNKIAGFILRKREEIGLTQADVANNLNVSFQAVSKWENGTLPNVERLVELAKLLHITVDELLSGEEKKEENFSYSKAGVDISYTDAMKKEMAAYLKTDNKRVLNGLGPFASLYDISFPALSDPVLVLKSEEPGSKQKLAMEYGYSESICHDMINHLVNDIAVMGAAPLAVLDTIVCGNAEKETIKSFVKGISEACIDDEEMLSTFNCGVGLTVVVSNNCKEQMIPLISKDYDCYEIGKIAVGNQKIAFKNHIIW